MYNLIVAGSEDAYDGEPLILEIGRCIREYTNTEITKQYGDFTESMIEKIRRFPTIFCYESSISKNPKLGLISGITQRQGKIKIDYELFRLENFIDVKQLRNLFFELDIVDWELNRTHWSIKDVNLTKELASRGIRLPEWIRNESKLVDITEHFFDVSLSFPGEEREIVKNISRELEKLIGPNSYFYDNNYKSQLARPSLDIILQDIYRNRSKLIVVFIGSKYQEKDWCGIEFRAIKEIIMKRQNEKVMFIRTDDGDVDGIFKNDGYIDAREYNYADLAKFIKERVALL